MRDEYLRLRRLVYKRQSLEDAASSLSSPGFEQSYNPNKGKSAPYEHYIIEAADMEEEIEKALMDCVNGIEEDNRRILTETSGQRQRVLRLRFLANKGIGEIADMLDISEKTVKRRLDKSVEEKPWESDFEKQYGESCMLRIDAEIEDHIAWTYGALQQLVGNRHEKIETLISLHREKAEECRRQYKMQRTRIERTLSALTEIERDVVESRLMRGQSWKEIEQKWHLGTRQLQRIFSVSMQKMSHLST